MAAWNNNGPYQMNAGYVETIKNLAILQIENEYHSYLRISKVPISWRYRYFLDLKIFGFPG
jgi:hypothetical protein